MSVRREQPLLGEPWKRERRWISRILQWLKLATEIRPGKLILLLWIGLGINVVMVGIHSNLVQSILGAGGVNVFQSVLGCYELGGRAVNERGWLDPFSPLEIWWKADSREEFVRFQQLIRRVYVRKREVGNGKRIWSLVGWKNQYGGWWAEVWLEIDEKEFEVRLNLGE